MIKILVISILFFLIGWYSKFVHFYSDVNYVNSTSVQLTKFLSSSNISITDDNFSCENEVERNAGKLFAKMVGNSMAHTASTMTAGCTNLTCSITYNYCKPWQNMECGSRILVYEIDLKHSIKADSFKCLDLP